MATEPREETLDERLRAVERALTDDETPVPDLADAADPGTAFLFHPNMLDYYDAFAEFEATHVRFAVRPLREHPLPS